MGLLGNRGRRAKPATVPKLFVCPIMLDIMTDPTTTACGHMFERDAILNWINAAVGPRALAPKRERERGQLMNVCERAHAHN